MEECHHLGIQQQTANIIKQNWHASKLKEIVIPYQTSKSHFKANRDTLKRRNLENEKLNDLIASINKLKTQEMGTLPN